ncbi:MAG: dynamin family protein [Albidovulum sp.]|uniref:dynamin family protein n=1 Tax=Albidovulum sp. TaxID=1872424 RepID=UPI003CAFB658
MQIAPLQKKQLDFLSATLDELQNGQGENGRKGYHALRQRLDGWAARIAVIGQVKAGKSSFMNAFLQNREFLPSDVNPWTSVVTNIRINVKGDPETGASFDFFDEKDWQEIIDGKSEVRKMTEELLPGFDTDLLREQSIAMRDRAQRRLGKHYHVLLGTSHSYDFVSPDLLSRYVCAGPGSDDGLDREALGRYASITKVANIYMQMPEFQVPAILTDTPGVNDPFLVRDEFTCRSLDKSDIFIVVLSAHQALTDVDIALIRILAQQDSKDVIIFINRIDEMEDYGTEVDQVIADVSARLSSDIPDIEFTIHAGSALFAEIAMREDDDAKAMRDEHDTEELRAYLEAQIGTVPEDQRERLLAASGLYDLKSTLSAVIDNGVGCQQLNEILADIRAEIVGSRTSAQQEQASLRQQLDTIGLSRSSDAIATLEAEIAELEGIQSEVQGLFTGMHAQVDKVVIGAERALSTSLSEAIEQFVEDQGPTIKAHLTGKSRRDGEDQQLSLDMQPLRWALERAVQTNFRTSRDVADQVLSGCLEACRGITGSVFGAAADGVSLDDLPFDEFASTLTLSKKRLDATLITDRSWAFWKRSSASIEKSLNALRVIAMAELRPSIEKIQAAFIEALTDRTHSGARRIGVILRTVETSVTERQGRLEQDKEVLDKLAANSDKLGAMSERLQQRLEVLEARLKRLRAIDGGLSKTALQDAA